MTLIGVRPERIVMAYPTVDAKRFRPGLPSDDLRASIGLQAEQWLVLSVGRLQRRKGFDQVIRALPRLVRRGIDVHHPIVGIAEDWDYLHGVARELGVEDRLHQLGQVAPADLPRWYNARDLFAMPNHDIEEDTEGFGVVYLQATAYARPAIAGRAGGAGSAVEDGVNGLRVDGIATASIEDGIAPLLLDDDFRRHIGDAGRTRSVDGFTPQKRVDSVRRVIGSA